MKHLDKPTIRVCRKCDGAGREKKDRERNLCHRAAANCISGWADRRDPIWADETKLKNDTTAGAYIVNRAMSALVFFTASLRSRSYLDYIPSCSLLRPRDSVRDFSGILCRHSSR